MWWRAQTLETTAWVWTFLLSFIHYMTLGKLENLCTLVSSSLNEVDYSASLAKMLGE